MGKGPRSGKRKQTQSGSEGNESKQTKRELLGEAEKKELLDLLHDQPIVGGRMQRHVVQRSASSQANRPSPAAVGSASDSSEDEVPQLPKGSSKKWVDDGNEDPSSNESLLADARRMQKDVHWKNKQRTMVFCSRDIDPRFRHLMEDVKKILPHHKAEKKFENKTSRLNEINALCETRSCNNVIYFEGQEKIGGGSAVFMYVSRVPGGPTLKFQVLNIHTTQEVKLSGNCIVGSRPLLQFDRHFDELPELKLAKTLLIQAMGTPRNHPKAKPYHDHVMSFCFVDGKIWFRHYQILPLTQDSFDDPDAQKLEEIGPRFVLEPVRFMSGSFSGQALYSNPNYISPIELRETGEQLLSKYLKRS